MSNDVNTELLERAALMLEYFTDKLPAQLIEKDLETNDLEHLAFHVLQAEGLASMEEFYAEGVL